MKNKLKINKIFKKLIFLAILLYVSCVFINQQKTLNSYKNRQAYYNEQLNKQLAYRESLYDAKNNINSEEYIEEMARDKLDMYLPNERVYIDNGN